MVYDDDFKRRAVRRYGELQSLALVSGEMGCSVASLSRWARDSAFVDDKKQGSEEAVDGLERLAPRAIMVFERVLNDTDLDEIKKIGVADKVLTLLARHKTADAARKVGDAVEHRMITGVELLAERAKIVRQIGVPIVHVGEYGSTVEAEFEDG